ncbi:MAG: helix-turn-helix domain-containing protein [Dysgonomonas mossii]|uniref:helix-turn-helix domain-containing protein n=1 Tax=Dysgonomonas mossii TaxID=163665 RepID=UPI001E0FEDAC|nr:helix-turn-helix domain-containing protein [Dysgonomonas mossii]MBS5796429.1 helix-turn-helix domain-containing protein [Dysgonomonas mossii]MBS7112530.1 helix-turn-helix domain-containing protein [Dysgonomonas mossii]
MESNTHDNHFSDGVREISDKPPCNTLPNEDAFDPEEWWNNCEVCEFLEISFRTLQRYRVKNIIPYIRVRDKYYYRSEDVKLLKNKNLK